MTADPTTTADTTTRSRRQVLCGLMVALIAPGALAACSTETPAPGGTPTTTGGGGGGATPAPGGALAAVADIPDGGGVLVEGPDTQILLVRTGEEVKAFNPACPHQGTIVNPPADGAILCPNHGSTFDPASGAVTRGPATAGLQEIPVKVEGGNVTLA
ncbi:Rieske (2Fe-2S) protein [Actinokineospora guangxiensis]|uniref:Cytochrome bc1 complex Rieske iron-sulfur subunit n=1 Tax=Actinokineospora guangxiensis TaxID=1490288 RepID=A0ABW0EQ43_9PSEU